MYKNHSLLSHKRVVDLLENSGILTYLPVKQNGQCHGNLKKFYSSLGCKKAKDWQKTPLINKIYSHDQPRYLDLLKSSVKEKTEKQTVIHFLSNSTTLVPCIVFAIPQTNKINSSSIIHLYILPQKNNWVFSNHDMQNNRLMNVGTLSLAVAHDLNNLHTGMLSFTDFINKKAKKTELLNYSKSIEKILKRANELTSSILQFVKGDEHKEQLQDPVKCLKEVALLSKKILENETNFKLSLPSSSQAIPLKQTEFCQIFFNFFFNAKDSVKGKGSIHVKGYYEKLQEKKYFVLEVKDNGPGISENVLPHVFSPFFTTKKKNDASGIGLAIVQNIIDNVEGLVKVQSIPNQSTIFSAFIPLITNSIS